jgi:hypothetical protein
MLLAPRWPMMTIAAPAAVSVKQWLAVTITQRNVIAG